MNQMTPEIARTTPPTGDKTPVDGPVVVGISDASLAEQREAVDFAVAEANRRDADLWLVHGCEPLATLTALTPKTTVSERYLAGQQIVQTISEYAVSLLDPSRKVVTDVTKTTGPEAMVDVSHVASLIVCGRRAVSTARRWHTGSTTGRVCAQAHAPVAVVKSDSGEAGMAAAGTARTAGEPTGGGQGENQAQRTDLGGVVVGVDGRGHSAVAIETALTEASLRGQRLIAVHAWQAPGPPEATGYISPDESELALLRGQAKERLAQAMTGRGGDDAGVEVTQRVVRGPAADALVDVSRSADLLVVARHAGHAVGSLGLGSVARHALSHAECPVIVTPTSRPAHKK